MGFLTILLPIISLVSLVGFIWLVRNAFRTSTGWGLAVLFLSPFSAIFYAVKNWEEARKPFLIYTGSTVANIAVVVLLFSAMGGFEVMSMAHEMRDGNVSEEQAAAFIDGQLNRFEQAGMLDAQGQADLEQMRGMLQDLGNAPDEAEEEAADPGSASADNADRPWISEPDTDPAEEIVAQAVLSRAQQAVQTANVLPLGPVRVGDAGRYLGAKMTVVGTDGIAHTGKLSSVDGDALWFEKYFSGGTFSLELKKSQIRSLEIVEN